MQARPVWPGCVLPLLSAIPALLMVPRRVLPSAEGRGWVGPRKPRSRRRAAANGTTTFHTCPFHTFMRKAPRYRRFSAFHPLRTRSSQTRRSTPMYLALNGLALYVRSDPRCLRKATPAPVMQLAVGRIASIDELMAKHDPILLYASRLLPAATASDASALYAWCRRLDEIVDAPTARGDPSGTQAHLDDWQRRFDTLCDGSPADEMDAALAACLDRHPSLGRQPFDDMIAGMRSDAVESRRVDTVAELEEYAYRVAGTVGLMLLPLLGGEPAAARAPAVALGRAIQLVNILRDATADAALGRIYLPREVMAAHGVDEADVLALRCTDGYRAAIAALAGRAASLLAEAEAGRVSLPGAGPLFVQIIIELYRDYLVELERRGYDNLSAAGERVRVGGARKLLATARAVVSVLS